MFVYYLFKTIAELQITFKYINLNTYNYNCIFVELFIININIIKEMCLHILRVNHQFGVAWSIAFLALDLDGSDAASYVALIINMNTNNIVSS